MGQGLDRHSLSKSGEKQQYFVVPDSQLDSVAISLLGLDLALWEWFPDTWLCYFGSYNESKAILDSVGEGTIQRFVYHVHWGILENKV